MNKISPIDVLVFFWKAHLIDQTNPRRHTANPPKEIHRRNPSMSW